MNKSKEDTIKILDIFNNFVRQLSSTDYQKLINGELSICCVDNRNNNLSEEDIKIYDSIINELIKINENDEIIKYLETNKYLSEIQDLIKFCENYKIKLKKDDEKDIIIEKIVKFISEEKEINKIVDIMKETKDKEYARNIIINSNILNNKINLLKLSKKLDVFIDKSKSKNDIIDRILKSVIDSKIRSSIIRGYD